MAGKYLPSVVFGCLLTLSSCSFLFSTFDTRYPTVITQHPGVNCPEEGSFPHPVDCTWYYRCVDKTGYGFFQVYFFKCEPGTVFSDGLDQCVYGDPSDCSGNLGANGQINPGRPTGPEKKPESKPAPATSQPEETDTNPTTTTVTVTQITTMEPTTPETDGSTSGPEPGGPPSGTKPGGPPSGPEPGGPPSGSKPDGPPSGPKPGGPPSGPKPDGPSGPEPGKPSPGSTPDVSPPGLPPGTDTSGNAHTTNIICNDCREKTVCKIGRKPFLVNVCQSCKFPSAPNFVTPKEECPYHPDPHLTSEGRCMAGNELCPEAPRINQSDQPQLEEPLYTIKCSDKKVRPDDPKIRDLFCQTYHFCSPFGSYQGTQTLCSNFFQCYKTREGYWTAELRNCIGNNLYSFDLDRCMAKPRELDLCEKR